MQILYREQSWKETETMISCFDRLRFIGLWNPLQASFPPVLSATHTNWCRWIFVAGHFSIIYRPIDRGLNVLYLRSKLLPRALPQEWLLNVISKMNNHTHFEWSPGEEEKTIWYCGQLLLDYRSDPFSITVFSKTAPFSCQKWMYLSGQVSSVSP